MKLPIKRLTETATMPTRAHEDDAGLDLYADFRRCIHDADPHELIIKPQHGALISTGIAVAVPPGHVGLVCPRSGLALHGGLTVANAPGVIDAGYTGEVKVHLTNHTIHEAAIKDGTRVAQLLIVPIPTIETEEVETLDDTERGTGGHGSTGA